MIGRMAIVVLLALASAAEAKTRIRLGGVSVGAGYSHFSGPYYYPYRFYPAFYSPYWDPFYTFYMPYSFYHPLYAGGFAQGPGMGEIRLQAVKDSEVYLDGAFAGVAGDLKSMWLEPGAYNVEVRRQDQTLLSRRIYVLSGKQLRLTADKSR